MALDVHAYESGRIGRLLFQIDDKLYGELDPAFALFKQRTGIFIDPYRDTVLSGELGALISCLEAVGYAASFLAVLKSWLADERAVIFVGD